MKNKYPRTSVKYWREKVEQTTSQSGALNQSYSVRINFKGKRVRFALQTANKNDAASSAAKIFSFLTENGWQKTLAKYKPSSHKPHTHTSVSGETTLGDLFATFQKYSLAQPQTIATYIKAFRKIAADINDLKYTHTTRAAWLDQVDSIYVSSLTPDAIQRWKQKHLAEQSNPKAQKQATITVNSLIRNARSLFSKRILPHLRAEISLPLTLPFDSIMMEASTSRRYHSQIDAKDIIAKASNELPSHKPEAYKIFLLALICGLRVSEIDYLQKAAFNFKNKTLKISHTEYRALKNEASSDELNLTDDMAEIFSKSFESTPGEFAIASGGAVKRSKTRRSYRCQTHLQHLIQWLRSHGVDALRPIHELRKEVGSIIASENGIFAASRYLRHSNIQITSQIYADQKNKITPSIGIGIV